MRLLPFFLLLLAATPAKARFDCLKTSWAGLNWDYFEQKTVRLACIVHPEVVSSRELFDLIYQFQRSYSNDDSFIKNTNPYGSSYLIDRRNIWIWADVKNNPANIRWVTDPVTGRQTSVLNLSPEQAQGPINASLQWLERIEKRVNNSKLFTCFCERAAIVFP